MPYLSSKLRCFGSVVVAVADNILLAADNFQSVVILQKSSLLSIQHTFANVWQAPQMLPFPENSRRHL